MDGLNRPYRLASLVRLLLLLFNVLIMLFDSLFEPFVSSFEFESNWVSALQIEFDKLLIVLEDIALIDLAENMEI